MLVVALPLSCSRTDQGGEVSDAQGCRTIVFPEPAEASTTSSETTIDTYDSSGSTSDTATKDTLTRTGSTTTNVGPACGDGVVDAGEECDASGESAECDDDCTAVECGDSNVNTLAGETCEAAESTADCEAATCNAPECGDGYVNVPAGEECDDGNVADGDGCGAECLVEHRMVFVTSIKFDPTFGGLAGADEICQGLAPKAGVFRAWLSDSTSGPSDRFGINPAFSGPFELVEGTVIAQGWMDLTDGALLHPIDVDENAMSALTPAVWTNTRLDGMPLGINDCAAWSSSDVAGSIGLSDQIDSQWTQRLNPANSCAASARLYCFQTQ